MKLPFGFPWRGVSDTTPLSEQARATTREARNMRVRDPRSGRLRGGSRSGLVGITTSPLPGKIDCMAAVTIDNPLNDYRNLSASEVVVESTSDLPQKQPVKALARDAQNNIYALDDRASIIKFNASGRRLQKIVLPVKDELHECRAFTVDPIDGNLYAAVSSGGAQATARMWAFKPAEDETMEKLWELELGVYVSALSVSEGRLYTAQNDPKQHKAEVVVYVGPALAVPEVLHRWLTSYPANALDVLPKDGTVYTTSPAFADRQVNPAFPAASPTYERWRPPDLPNWEKRVRAWLRADAINGLDDDGDPLEQPEDGDEVTTWFDSSGNFRNMYAPYTPFATGLSAKAPIFREKAGAGLPAVKFSSSAKMVLESLGNNTVDPNLKDQQGTLLPAYGNAGFALIMAVRITKTAGSGTGTDGAPGTILAQHNAKSGLDYELILSANRADAQGAGGGSADAGKIKLNERASAFLPAANGAVYPSGPAGTTPVIGEVDATSYFAVISWVFCPATADNMTAFGSADRSLFRVNGKPLDVFMSQGIESKTDGTGPTRFGLDAANSLWFDGEILEVLVLHDQGTAASASDFSIIEAPRYPDVATNPDSDTELERVEGYMHWRWGRAGKLENGASFPHPFHISKGPPDAEGRAKSAKHGLLFNAAANVTKFTPDKGGLRWIDHGRAGTGYGVAATAKGGVFTSGPLDNAPLFGLPNISVRKIVDLGDTFVADGTGGSWLWPLAGGGYVPLDQTPKLVVDEFGNLYFPFVGDGFEPPYTLAVFAEFYASAEGMPILGWRLETDNDFPQGAWALALPYENPVYPDGFSQPRAELAWLGLAKSDHTGTPDDLPAFARARLVEAVPTSGPPRDTVVVVVSAGRVYEIALDGTVTDTTEGAAPWQDPTGEDLNPLDARSQTYSIAVLRHEAVITDGKGYVVYDAKKRTLAPLQADGSGEVPPRFRLLSSWRNRLVAGRGVDYPADWWMSASGNIRDLDFRPVSPSGVEAVRGRLLEEDGAEAGLPHVITALIPATDDVLIIGCDSSIWRLTGDPARDGQIDQISRGVGMAYGPSWAMDPEGVIYFVANEGGLYRLAPGGAPQPMSLHSIEERLRSVDRSTHFFCLAWNRRDDGLHLFVCPFVGPVAPGEEPSGISHFFWERVLDAWAPWPDSFSAASLDPSWAVTVDGDAPDDRRLWVGCVDGHVRAWESTAQSDAGHPIDALVLLGPLVGKERMRFRALEAVLAIDQGGCEAEVLATDDPGFLPEAPTESVHLAPGRNPRIPFRARAKHLYLRLRSSSTRRFALESIEVEAFGGGRARV